MSRVRGWPGSRMAGPEPMTIRAKLYTAILLTILGPLATTAVALHGMGEMGDSFDAVDARARDEALARELKFGVTDMNGWQTAYGYDDGRSRPRFVRSAAELRRNLEQAADTFTQPRERSLLGSLQSGFDRFMALDVVAWRALQAGDAPADEGHPPRARAGALRGDGGRRRTPGLVRGRNSPRTQTARSTTHVTRPAAG